MSATQLRCISCLRNFALWDLRYSCDCGGLLEVQHPTSGFEYIPELVEKRLLSRKPADRSGVWRFREALVPLGIEELVTHQEGQTGLYAIASLSEWGDCHRLSFKHEGENPSGSFKDRGMTVAVSAAKRLGMTRLACASTGNTSSSLAAYAARAGVQALVFLPSGKVSLGKMAQTMGYGALALEILGDFDDAMRVVRGLAVAGEVYMVNSLNPFRIEGQKTIIWELLQDLSWEAPDWIVVPGGNLGNASAFGKAIEEAYQWRWIKKKPRLAVIQAEGASPFYKSFRGGFHQLDAVQAETVATAIRIGNPVNYARAVQSITKTDGLVAAVSDAEILLAKAAIDRAGLGCEPASAATLAGIKKLRASQTIGSEESVVAVLTGHMLKDAESILLSQLLETHKVAADEAAIRLLLQQLATARPRQPSRIE